MKIRFIAAAVLMLVGGASVASAGQLDSMVTPPMVRVLDQCEPLKAPIQKFDVLLMARAPGALECQIEVLKANPGAFMIVPSKGPLADPKARPVFLASQNLAEISALHPYAAGQLIAVGPDQTVDEVAYWLGKAMPEALDDAWRGAQTREAAADPAYLRHQAVILAASRLGWGVY